MKPRPAFQAKAAHKARKAKGRAAHQATPRKPRKSFWDDVRVTHKNNPFRAASVAAMLAINSEVRGDNG